MPSTSFKPEFVRQYWQERMRPRVWGAVALAYGALAFGWIAAFRGVPEATRESATFAFVLMIAGIFVFLLALRVLDDLGCTAFEIFRGYDRFYHASEARLPLLVFGGVLLCVSLDLAGASGRSGFLLFVLALVSFLLYRSFARHPERAEKVQFVSLLKYPFVFLWVTSFREPAAWAVALVIAVFVYLRESSEIRKERV